MYSRRRNLLHRNKLGEFRSWAVDHGFVVQMVKGPWEVLRLCPASGGPPVLFYERASNGSGDGAGSDHITTFGLGTDMVRAFLRDTQLNRVSA